MAGIDSRPRQEERRKRVQIMKRIIIFTILTAIVLPTVLCIVLSVKLGDARRQLEQLQTAIAAAGPVAEEEIARTSIFVTSQLEESARTENEILFEQITEETERIKIYLTFDDGPSSNTGDILDILKEYDVKATFFVVGKTDDLSRQVYRRIVEEGHTLGMHSYSHRYQEIYRSVESFSADLTRLQEYLYEETGVWCTYCRFPGGSSNTVSHVDMQELIDYLGEQNISYYDWNIASGDAASGVLSAEQIAENCLAGIVGKRTGIILLHDAAEKRTTVEALPLIIEGLLATENVRILPINDDTVPVRHMEALLPQ